MSPYAFDLVVLLLVLLSAGLGFLRGFCNEIFTIFGWIGAVVATILLTPPARVLLKDHIHSEIVAGLATASVIFIVTMVLFSIVSHYATRSLQAGKLGPVDRTLGFGFGLLRGVLFVGLMYLLILFVFSSDNRPAFIQEAKTRPILEASAELVQFVLPGDVMIDVKGDNKGNNNKGDGKNDGQTDAGKDAGGAADSAQRADDDSAQRADDLEQYKAKDPVTGFQRQTRDEETTPAEARPDAPASDATQKGAP